MTDDKRYVHFLRQRAGFMGEKPGGMFGLPGDCL